MHRSSVLPASMIGLFLEFIVERYSSCFEKLTLPILAVDCVTLAMLPLSSSTPLPYLALHQVKNDVLIFYETLFLSASI